MIKKFLFVFFMLLGISFIVYGMGCVVSSSPKVDPPRSEKTLSFRSNRCALFEKTFNAEGFVGIQEGLSGQFNCRLIDGIGARCMIRYESIESGRNQNDLQGEFFEVEMKPGIKIVIIQIHDQNGNTSRLYCAENGCYAMQTYSEEKQIGVQCLDKDVERQIGKKKETVDL